MCEREVPSVRLIDQPVEPLDRVSEPGVDERRGPGEARGDRQVAIGDPFGDLDRLAEQRDRLLLGPGAGRDIGGHHQVRRGLGVVTGLAKVVRGSTRIPARDRRMRAR